MNRVIAVELLIDGEVIRYGVGKLSEESRWDSPAVKSPEVPVVELPSSLCKCGHSELDHLPACIWIVHGCECEGFEKASEMGTAVVRPVP